ncbi:MAG: NAD(P)-binding domain-containing protein [Planctomycetales bacterium]
MTTSRPPVGMIGLGLMGAALSERLLQAGYPVLGYDLDPERRLLLKTLGGNSCESAAEVFQTAERCVLSLPNSEVVAALLQDVGRNFVPGS